MKQPNKFGTVSLICSKKDKHKRRKPYRVQVNIGWKLENDKAVPIRKTLGYVKSREEGQQMLAEYHNEPYDLDNRNITFDDLYLKWKNYKEQTNVNEDTIKKYDIMKKYYYELGDKTFSSIVREDLQDMINKSKDNTSGEYQKRILNLYNQMYEYAKGNGMRVGGDASKFVITEEIKPSTLHKIFTDDEIRKLWNNRNEIIDLILIETYTGIRPVEFFNITEVGQNYFITGSKTDAGKNRLIPLHRVIKDMFHRTYKSDILNEINNPDNLYRRYQKEFTRLKMEHTPYDCRHTFATLCSRYNLDKHIVKLIMGHRIQDLTERVYTHKLKRDLIDEINKIIV